MEDKPFTVYRCIVVLNRKEESIIKETPTIEDIRLDIMLNEIHRLYNIKWGSNES